jgi:TIGR00255 family protein
MTILRSMTGFGRAEAESGGRRITIELKAVNQRYLDVNIRAPISLGFAEEHIRKTAKERLSRGRVDIFMGYSALEAEARKATADLGLITSYVQTARQAAGRAGLEDDVKLSHILRIPDVIRIEGAQEDEEKLLGLVDKALCGALDALVSMRSREGASLQKSIEQYLGELTGIVNAINAAKDDVPRESAEKLKQRISELLGGSDIDEARFNTEVAYIADRADICEELVRLKTHIAQFEAAVKTGEAVGRKLDFMVQEMNRELNTIGSKSSSMTITNAVIEGKSVVEKIREQVQNIE